jgi:hypothetical protein
MENVENGGYVVCIRNDGVPAALELRKIYQAMPDFGPEEIGMVRVMDESGEDYLYPADWFIPIELTNELQSALRLASLAD